MLRDRLHLRMPIKIYTTDSVREAAEKIYNSFEPGDMVQIFGWVEKERKLIAKGDAVLEVLRWLYERDNYGHQGRAREYKYRKDSIGGAIAHKIWTWEKRIVDQEPRIMIWRIQ